jgi:hypothetical protein
MLMPAQTNDDGNADNQPCDNVANGDPPAELGAKEPPTEMEDFPEPLVKETPAPPLPYLLEAPPAHQKEVPMLVELQDFPHPGMDEGADLPGFVPAAVNGLLDSVYVDHPHHNDGWHLDGGVADDAQWQRRWRQIADLPMTHYSMPKGHVGR